MYINYKIKDGIEYAMVVTSVRKGSSVTKEKPLYLGRVIDKEHGIFKNRERGIFKYDIKTNTIWQNIRFLFAVSRGGTR